MSTRLDMGDDMRRALAAAWERVRPILEADPGSWPGGRARRQTHR